VRRGLVPTRQQAQAAIDAGRVLVGGAPADKAARLVDPGEPIALTGPPPRYVSRGGDKLEAALDHFDIDVTGRRALDAGASTGGFTDCLLQRGAASVVAVDVGRGQLHERLRADPRVQVLERTNIRSLSLADAGGQPFDLLVADLSFISLKSVAGALLDELTGPGADVIVLIKPQFEAGRRVVSAGKGVIRDRSVWSEVLTDVLDSLIGHGAAMMGVMVSPVTGADGNVEFLAHLRAHTPNNTATPNNAATLNDRVDQVVAEAVRRHGSAS
jgi:23S rRNA (cytidine1920-2'-O)/16S rRNA (cytidine1409-2'-O)-methyltransferase